MIRALKSVWRALTGHKARERGRQRMERRGDHAVVLRAWEAYQQGFVTQAQWKRIINR